MSFLRSIKYIRTVIKKTNSISLKTLYEYTKSEVSNCDTIKTAKLTQFESFMDNFLTINTKVSEIKTLITICADISLNIEEEKILINNG